MSQPLRPILWDIHEEHLREAGFLWKQWERALVAPNLVPEQVASGPEERLLAHLDALVLGGEAVAERLLGPALDDDDPELAFAGAWALASAEPSSAVDRVIDRLVAAKPRPAAAIARALSLSPRRDVAARLAARCAKAEPPATGLLLEGLAAIDPAAAVRHLPRCASQPDAPGLAACLRALRLAPDPALGDHAVAALRAESAAVRAEAIATGILLDQPSAWTACRREAERIDADGRLPLALLALRARTEDRRFIESLLGGANTRWHALWALAFVGDVAAGDVLVDALEDAKVARVAAEALSAMTSLPIQGRFALPGESQGPGVGDLRPDDPIPELAPDDALPAPNPPVVRKWWGHVRRGLSPAVRYVRGHPRERMATRDGLAHGTMWRRPAMLIDAAVTARAPAFFDTRTWARRQR